MLDFCKRNFVLLLMLISVVLFTKAMLSYPGGTNENHQTEGYSFFHNYISHLLDDTAVNGKDNAAKPFAVLGVIFMGLATGFALLRLANKVDEQKFSLVIKVLAFILLVSNMLVTISSLHNLMVTLGSVCLLVLFFYVLILFHTYYHPVFKPATIILMVLFYIAAYMYFTQTGLTYLPAIQKLIHLTQMAFILALEYGLPEGHFKKKKFS